MVFPLPDKIVHQTFIVHSGIGIGLQKFEQEVGLLQTVDAIKRALMERGPIPVGLNRYSSFGTLNSTTHDYDPQPGEAFVGTHNILLIGWKDNYLTLQVASLASRW